MNGANSPYRGYILPRGGAAALGPFDPGLFRTPTGPFVAGWVAWLFFFPAVGFATGPWSRGLVPAAGFAAGFGSAFAGLALAAALTAGGAAGSFASTGFAAGRGFALATSGLGDGEPPLPLPLPLPPLNNMPLSLPLREGLGRAAASAAAAASVVTGARARTALRPTTCGPSLLQCCSSGRGEGLLSLGAA
jgi:hypothetical protein